MNFLSKNELDLIKTNYPIGTRIKLINMEGESQMYPGLCGTVSYLDDLGQIHVNWDNGSSLALIPGVDSFKVLKEKEVE